MPRARVEQTWHSCAVPTTCRAREHFLDLCTTWLVEGGAARPPHALEPAAEAGYGPPTCLDATALATTGGPPARAPGGGALGTCDLCGEAGVDTVALLANSFAHNAYLAACAPCRGAG